MTKYSTKGQKGAECGVRNAEQNGEPAAQVAPVEPRPAACESQDYCRFIAFTRLEVTTGNSSHLQSSPANSTKAPT
jgi:hypothetical protein